MLSHSIVLLAGNLVSPLRFRLARDEIPVCDGTIAVNHQFKRLEETTHDVAYVDITTFGQLAKAFKDVEKGAGLYCEGRLKSESWTDQRTGQRKFRLKVVAERLRRLPGRNPGSTEPLTPSEAQSA